jgi:glycosyltransferase involved in cell wall biosynthesis
VTRRVILHHHFFKNAGSSVDALLAASFPGQWMSAEFEPADSSANVPKVGQWMLAHPDIVAFSSHTAGFPAPAIADVHVFPIVFIRHPIDRIWSAYEFERCEGMSGSQVFGQVLARHTGFAGYVDVQLAFPGYRQCRNFHTARLAHMFPAASGSEEKRALRALTELPFAGVVDRYERSIEALVEWLRPHFPRIRQHVVRENATAGRAATLAERLKGVRAELGPALFARLMDANAADLRLYEFALARLLDRESRRARDAETVRPPIRQGRIDFPIRSPDLGVKNMGSDGFISVIVPARNAERYIKRTLESVLNQTHQDFEIVVVDNASTDTTAAIVTELAQRDPRIRLVRAQNIGVSAARNLAIKEARGELIAPVDADDVWHPEKLARQLAVMCAAGPNVGVVYCWSAGIDDEDRIILAAWTKSYAVGNVLHDIVVSGIVGNGSVPLLRRKYIDAVGGYDENLYLCEDWKFYTALAGACEFAVIPECLIGYRLRADSASMSVRPMDEAIKQVTAWIVQTWPKIPKGVLLDREYTVKAYLAFLAIRSGLYLDALRYLARAAIFSPDYKSPDRIPRFPLGLLAQAAKFLGGDPSRIYLGGGPSSGAGDRSGRKERR